MRANAESVEPGFTDSFCAITQGAGKLAQTADRGSRIADRGSHGRPPAASSQQPAKNAVRRPQTADRGSQNADRGPQIADRYVALMLYCFFLMFVVAFTAGRAHERGSLGSPSALLSFLMFVGAFAAGRTQGQGKTAHNQESYDVWTSTGLCAVLTP